MSKTNKQTSEIYIIKKDGTIESYDEYKIINAVSKSASRVMIELSENEYFEICSKVFDYIIESGCEEIPVEEMHNIVEIILDSINKDISNSYKEYRNYKKDFVHLMDEVYTASQNIRYVGDKENSNTDSSLVSTKRSLIFNELNKRLYRRFFLTKNELQACNEGFIYVHDQNARLDSLNCNIFNVEKVMTGGFEMGNIHYTEPNSLDVAFDVLGDIIFSSASQQYGGYTVPNIDILLKPYAKKSYEKYLEDIKDIKNETVASQDTIDRAKRKVLREFEQGFQGLEYKLNSVGNSRGDYVFVSITFGLDTTEFGKMASKTFLQIHMNGHGKKGFERILPFPKLIFLYDENIHGEGKINEDIFNLAIQCSSKSMYPDFLSLTGDGYVSDMYKKYGIDGVVHPMGCRAFLSPYFESGNWEQQHENDKPVFVGRFNCGAISLHLPMILAKSRHENQDFYETLDTYLEIIRNVHKRTYEYLGELKASTNPLSFCEGGLYGGNLKPDDKIKPLLKSATFSFGITALNELQQLYNKKSLVEDGQFAIDVMKYINEKINQFKNEDGLLYAIYSTPAESLVATQVKQFRKKYGIIENVSDKDYMSNSFHCHVSENITPVEKQDLENRFWNLTNGGKIQYVKYPINYNLKAMKTLVRRAMTLGFYEGLNLSLSFCNDCGYEELNMEICPKCQSDNLTKIERMNGYLSYSRVNGDTRLNDAKMSEIKDRKSM